MEFLDDPLPLSPQLGRKNPNARLCDFIHAVCLTLGIFISGLKEILLLDSLVPIKLVNESQHIMVPTIKFICDGQGGRDGFSVAVDLY
jgi:hypothetical protein